MNLDHPDWFEMRMLVTGPLADLNDLRRAAAGSGTVGWAVDYDQVEQDFIAAMLAPAARGERLSVSLDGVRIIAREMREMMWEACEVNISAVGVSKACLFDLNALVPAPWDILRLGQRHPDAERWMWEHWGSIWPLRRVEAGPAPPAHRPKRLPDGHDAWFVRAWCADWGPWPVIKHCMERWPALRFSVDCLLAEEEPAPAPSPKPRRAPRDVGLRAGRAARERTDLEEARAQQRPLG
jgi:hypothetical protein